MTDNYALVIVSLAIAGTLWMVSAVAALLFESDEFGVPVAVFATPFTLFGVGLAVCETIRIAVEA